MAGLSQLKLRKAKHKAAAQDEQDEKDGKILQTFAHNTLGLFLDKSHQG
jgi:hypothetical protein